MRCRYNAINFSCNLHNRHPIVRPSVRHMGCLLWVQYLIYSLLWLLQCCHDIFDRLITALQCIRRTFQLSLIGNVYQSRGQLPSIQLVYSITTASTLSVSCNNWEYATINYAKIWRQHIWKGLLWTNRYLTTRPFCVNGVVYQTRSHSNQ